MNVTYSEHDLVSSLPGCGKITVQRLNNCNIHTIKDLIQFEGKIKDVPLDKLKQIAKKKTNKKIELSEHSWKGHFAHIVRSKGQITRVQIDTLLIAPHRILLNVVWKEGKNIRRKSVSPSVVLCLQITWLNQVIVSDDSESESHMPPVTNTLPEFFIGANYETTKNLDTEQKRALKSLQNEINQIAKVLI